MSTAAPSSKPKVALRLALGALVSLATLWLAFRKVQWRDAWQIIRHANGWLILAALASVLLTTAIRSERWRMMFYPDQRRLHPTLFFAVFLMGQMINALTPARLGEVARAVLVGKRERLSVATGLWSAVTEKVLDALVLLFFLALSALWAPLPGWLQSAGWTLSGGILLTLAFLGVAAWRREQTLRWLGSLASRWPWSGRLRLVRLAESVFDSLRLLKQPRLSLALAAYSLGAFLAGAATNWLTARAIGLPLSFRACLLLLSVLQISAVVPLPTTPGRVGLFHYLCVISLAIYAVPQDVALSYGLILHVLVYLPMSLGGPLALWLLNVSWRSLTHPLEGK